MMGILGLLGVDLNPANLIVLPLVIGIGVDDGVHVLHDFHQQTANYRMSASTTNAIVLTSLTSMIGFGSMMVASHRGLYSLGLVLVEQPGGVGIDAIAVDQPLGESGGELGWSVLAGVDRGGDHELGLAVWGRFAGRRARGAAVGEAQHPHVVAGGAARCRLLP